ncbi:poly(3-hydroxyalkanoate) granule-associated protein PhaF, partial [Pseudomonas aeruginosa]|nr:poly(3-hydroxyalkanoate) granule-associated protein PhaF [Pseudomonas aeruginosa]
PAGALKTAYRSPPMSRAATPAASAPAANAPATPSSQG